MKPESTAAIPKGITTGYSEMVTQMHSQTRWPSIAIDLISVIFFAHPNLFKLICGFEMDMIRNNFCVFYNPILQTLLHMFLELFFYLFFKDNDINVNIPNLLLQYINFPGNVDCIVQYVQLTHICMYVCM